MTSNFEPGSHLRHATHAQLPFLTPTGPSLTPLTPGSAIATCGAVRPLVRQRQLILRRRPAGDRSQRYIRRLRHTHWQRWAGATWPAHRLWPVNRESSTAVKNSGLGSPILRVRFYGKSVPECCVRGHSRPFRACAQALRPSSHTTTSSWSDANIDSRPQRRIIYY
jgi:hypothetical protein